MLVGDGALNDVQCEPWGRDVITVGKLNVSTLVTKSAKYMSLALEFDVSC